jgi:hypothetical protein
LNLLLVFRPAVFSDYFQMSPTMANTASKQFDDVMGRGCIIGSTFGLQQQKT